MPPLQDPVPHRPPSATDASDVATWAPSLAQAFTGLACDLALVLDAAGVVVWAAEGGRPPLPELAAGWVGHAWADTIVPGCQGKVRSLLSDLAGQGVAARREMDLATEPPLPMAFAALRLGAAGPSVLLGHDLRPEAALQQRFLRAQRDLEQGYQEALDQLALQAADARQAAAIASLLPAAQALIGPTATRRAAVRRHPRPRRRKRSSR